MGVYWMFVFGDSRALQWVIDNKRMAFRQHVRTDEVSAGHRFVVYTSRGAYGNPTKDDAQVLGIGSITSAVGEGDVAIGNEVFSKSCKVEMEVVLPLRSGIKFRPLIPRLAFVKGSERRWPSAVHRTLVKLPPQDFDVIAAAILAESD